MLSREVGESSLTAYYPAPKADGRVRTHKNTSVRVRRCVLGEIKEKPDGGLYYTKQMRALFNCLSDVREFLQLNESEKRMDGYFYFYRQLLSFYKSLHFIRRYGEKYASTPSKI